jgi:hypothetical protein
MEKVYIIGDCHLSRVSEHWYPENSSIDFTIWGKAAHKIAGISFKEMLESDMLSSGVEIARGIDHKPIGENKYFHLIFIYEKFNNLNDKKLTIEQIWQHLNELYDMKALVFLI